MRLQWIDGDYCVCKLENPGQARACGGFFSLTQTAGEVSLVCEQREAPAETLAREDGWRMFRVAGALDFSLTGILAELSSVLAANGVALFALSTFDTDYILVKRENAALAEHALLGAGHAFATG